MRIIILFVTILLAAACDRSVVTTPDDLNPTLDGSWLLFETGLSPGAGYTVTPVPDTPPQTVTFLNGKALVSTVTGMEQYKFFVIENDTNNQITQIRFFEDDPSANPDQSSLQMRVEMTGTKLKLMPVGCIEGCHMAFSKLKGSGQ